MDMIFSIFFFLIFALVAGGFIVTLVGGISTWNKNNHSPRLTVTAKVVSKRMDISHHSQANAGDMTGAHGYTTTSSTSYYVTFQVDSGDRMELSVSGSEYGMLAEGDAGQLSFQGTRYLSFERSGEIPV
ncbi:MAG: DUF2500 domain-containing protein [Lachnospiraceae bacterium]|nr:DUF2500 domain-containing protein [Lachnospiraceae bacterium]